MDELKEAWQHIDHNTYDSVIIDKEQLQKGIHAKSIGVIANLNKRLKWKLWMAWSGIVFFVALPFFAPNKITLLLISIILLVNIVGSLMLRREQKLINQEVDLTANLKLTLERFYNRVKKILWHEEMIGLTVYPISGSAGFLIGINWQNPDIDFFSTYKGWMIWAVFMIIITPISHWLTKSMNKWGFGKYLNLLKEDIDQLKNNNENTKL